MINQTTSTIQSRSLPADTHDVPIEHYLLEYLLKQRFLTEPKMAQDKPVYDYHEESHGERLARKSKESPFMIIGIAGLLASVGFGAYSYKRRGAMSTSVFLMQFRVIAQGTAVGALTAGMAYTLFRNHFNKSDSKVAIADNVLTKSNEH